VLTIRSTAYPPAKVPAYYPDASASLTCRCGSITIAPRYGRATFRPGHSAEGCRPERDLYNHDGQVSA
jgi:hypothetical protein